MKTLSSFKMPFHSVPPLSQREGVDKPKLKKAISIPITHDNQVETALLKKLQTLASQDFSPKRVEVILAIRKASNQLRDKTKKESFIERMTRFYPNLFSIQSLCLQDKQAELENTVRIPSLTEKGETIDNLLAIWRLSIEGIFQDLRTMGKELTPKEQEYIRTYLHERHILLKRVQQ